jgi:hypothetical protein
MLLIAQGQRPDMAVPLFRGYSGQLSNTIFVFLSQCEHGHIAQTRSVLAIQPRDESARNAPKVVHCPHRDRGPSRCWDQGGRTEARLDQELFHRCQDSGAQRHEEFSERAAATVMSALAQSRHGRVHCTCLLLGVKRTGKPIIWW